MGLRMLWREWGEECERNLNHNEKAMNYESYCLISKMYDSGAVIAFKPNRFW